MSAAVTVSIAGIALAYTAAIVAGLFGATTMALRADLVSAAGAGGASVLSWRAGRGWTGRADVSRAWFAISAACAAWCFGEIFSVAQASGQVWPGLSALSTVAYVAFYPLAGFGVVSLSRKPISGIERLRSVVDTLSVIVAALLFVAVLVGPWATGGLDIRTLRPQIVYSAGDAIVIVALFLTVLRWPTEVPRGPIARLSAGLVLLLATDLVADVGDVGVVLVPPVLTGVMALAGIAIVCWAAATQTGARPVVARRISPNDHVRALLGFLPLAVVVVGLTAVLVDAADHADSAAVILLGGGIALSALAGFGQLLTQCEASQARAAEARAIAQARFGGAIEHPTDVLLTIGSSGQIASANGSLERLTGFRPDESVGVPFLDRVVAEDRPHVARILRGGTHHGHTAPAEFEFRMLRSDERAVDVEASVTDLRDDETVGGLVLAVRDIAERQIFESDLRRQAFHDQLTGLPNRAHFMDRTGRAIARAVRSGDPLHVLYLDIDGFKRINDSLGHDAGDQVLRVVAERLTWSVRAGDTVARLGGDEFAVLLESHASVDVARGVAARVQEVVATPIEVEGRRVRVGVSIGIASPSAVTGGARRIGDRPIKGAVVADELIRDADVAMWEAKQRERGGVSIYEPAMRLAAVTRLDLETALREATERREFVVHYQPVVDLAQGSIVGMEALVRWDRPGIGLVSPASFIPVAEETGLIRTIGVQVLRSACEAAARWSGAPEPVGLSVNLSARQLLDPPLVATVRRVLNETSVDPHRLTLEITESSLIEEGSEAIAQLGRLRALGIQLAIDDFGTGYSSLGYLEQLPVDILKIDRAFVMDLTTSPRRSALLKAITGMASALNLTTIAEGIETEAQLRLVRDVGCDLAQGFLMSGPLPGSEATDLLAADGSLGGAFRRLVHATPRAAETAAVY